MSHVINTDSVPVKVILMLLLSSVVMQKVHSNEPVLVSLEQPSYSVREDLTDGKGFGLLICAIAQETVNQNFTVVLETSTAAAAAGMDFVATAQELNFAPSSNIRQCACIQIINDAIAESSEDFTVGLRSTNGEVLQGITTATVTILDDDDGDSCVPILAVEGDLMRNILISSSDCMMFPTLPPTTDPPTRDSPATKFRYIPTDFLP